nr:hypothetical protein [Tanacetum cinerariifolium]
MVNGGEGGGEVNGDRRRRFMVIWEVNGGRFGEGEGDLELYVQEEGEDQGKDGNTHEYGLIGTRGGLR